MTYSHSVRHTIGRIVGTPSQNPGRKLSSGSLRGTVTLNGMLCVLLKSDFLIFAAHLTFSDTRVQCQGSLGSLWTLDHSEILLGLHVLMSLVGATEWEWPIGSRRGQRAALQLISTPVNHCGVTEQLLHDSRRLEQHIINIRFCYYCYI